MSDHTDTLVEQTLERFADEMERAGVTDATFALVELAGRAAAATLCLLSDDVGERDRGLEVLTRVFFNTARRCIEESSSEESEFIH